MASTFSTNLAIELIGTGDQAGTWGTTTNSNLGTLIEQAISGYVTQAVATGTDTTITIPNGATGVARNMYIELTGTGGTNTNLIVPANKKLYFIFNNSTGAVTVKVSGQTGVSVPTGKKMVLVSNGTDIVNGLNYIADFGTNSFSVTNLTASSGTITNLIATSGSITNLVSSDASATVLRAGSATLTHLSATSASITNLSLTSLTISSLSITNVSVASATVSSNLTLSGGTANGVLYLNGSKVATSGSALVFDGTNLGIGTASPGATLDVVGTARISSTLNVGGSGSGSRLVVRGTGTTSATFSIEAATSGGATRFLVADDGLCRWYGTSNAETMRLDNAGNLGISTATPRGNLDVSSGSATGSQTRSIHLGYSSADFYGFRVTNINDAGATYAGTFRIQRGVGSSWSDDVVVNDSGNVGIGTASPAYKLDVRGAATDFGGLNILNTEPGSGTQTTSSIRLGITNSIGIRNTRITAVEESVDSNAVGLAFFTNNTNALNAEGQRMYLDSSGNLGIGTAIPSSYLSGTAKLVAYANANSQNSILVRNDSNGASSSSALVLNASGNTWGIEIGSSAKNSNALTFQLDYGGANSTLMTLTSSGNLGLGVTPSAWSIKALQVNNSSIANDSNDTYIQSNAFFDGSWKYINSAEAAQYYQVNGSHVWRYAASGTAGNAISFTQAMTLTAGGDLGVGTTSPGQKLEVAGNQRFTGSQVGTKIENQQTGVSVSTATTILDDAGVLGRLVIVNGISSGDRFCDLVLCSTGVSPTVVSSFTALGSPAARTYTRSGSALQLAMASGTYTVTALALGY